jgi:hypothetical protein
MVWLIPLLPPTTYQLDDRQHPKNFKAHLSILKDLSVDQKNIVVYGKDSLHDRTGRQNFVIMIWQLVISYSIRE